MGIEASEILQVGALLGTKLSINEFVAYLDLVALQDSLSPRSFTIATFALCGFANLGSVAILIGGIGTLAPERKGELAKLGLKMMFAGALACLVHALLPFFCVTTGSDCIRRLHDRMVVNRHNLTQPKADAVPEGAD